MLFEVGSCVLVGSQIGLHTDVRTGSDGERQVDTSAQHAGKRVEIQPPLSLSGRRVQNTPGEAGSRSYPLLRRPGGSSPGWFPRPPGRRHAGMDHRNAMDVECLCDGIDRSWPAVDPGQDAETDASTLERPVCLRGDGPAKAGRAKRARSADRCELSGVRRTGSRHRVPRPELCCTVTRLE